MSKWRLDDGRTIMLITPEELKRTPSGTSLICIDGREAVVGKDHIDDDTRFGYLAFGHLLSNTEQTMNERRAENVVVLKSEKKLTMLERIESLEQKVEKLLRDTETRR